MRLLLLVATAAAAGSWFDGAGRAPLLPPAPRTAATVAIAVNNPGSVPSDLLAASARVGNAAMIARLAGRASSPFAFGVLGDSEPGRFWFQRWLNPGDNAFLDQWRSLQNSGVDFTLQLGDFVSKGNVENYRKHVGLVERETAAPILRTIGNHDRSQPNGDADKSLYDAVFGARNYHFDHGGWRFISLDSSDRRLSKAQLAWLKVALSAPGPKVIFTHVPPAYIKGLQPLAEVEALSPSALRVSSEEEKRSFLEDFFTSYFEDGSEEFDGLVSNGGVKAVYMGHIHAFWAADHRGVRYIISGGGGSPLYNPLPPGYPTKHFAHALRVEAGPNGLTETVIPYSGKPFVLPPVKL